MRSFVCQSQRKYIAVYITGMSCNIILSAFAKLFIKETLGKYALSVLWIQKLREKILKNLSNSSQAANRLYIINGRHFYPKN